LTAGPDDASGRHPDLDSEQRYVDDAYVCLDRMRAHARELLRLKQVADTVDDEILRWHLQERVASLADSKAPLVFGRLDEQVTDETLYVGRRHVRDPDGDVKVVDWRARAAAPFYRATIRDPMDVHRRRRFAMEGRELLDIFDEYLDDPDSVIEGSHGGVPDPLLAEIGRARTGQMRDIVATIQGEQDEIIRSPLEELVVVQGGPGTGKTAVGLHRTAFLLYEHRATLERERVLIVGPNRLFLSYIENVLPSLGETAVYQTTVLGLAARYQKVRREDDPAVTRLKGDLRMAEVLRRACWSRVRAAEGSLRAVARGVSIDVAADDVNAALMEGMRARSYRDGRRLFLELLGRRILAERELDIYALGLDGPEFVEEALRKTLEPQLRRLWPNLGHEAVVRRLLTNKAALAQAAEGLYSADEQILMRRHSGPELKDAGWSTSDVPLLDECDALVNGPPPRYGHAVVDEAQDLSAMELRMVGRRTRASSMTILGDLAQATAAGSQSSWDDVLEALDRPLGATFRELTIGYRVPFEIMDFANRLLPLAAPGTRASSSVRASNEPPRIVRSSGGYLLQDVEAEVRTLSKLWQTVGVVCPEALAPQLDRSLAASEIDVGSWETGLLDKPVTLLSPLAAKGLEFDAVVVVEPALVMAEDRGARRLYVALTRAVQHLSIVHEAPLPDVLQPERVA
jgi:DNA helicase IV